MASLVKQIHWIVILYTLWVTYGMYEVHVEEIASLNSQITVQQNKIAKAKRDKRRLEEYYRNIEKAKDKINTIASKVEKLQAQLPNVVNIDDIKKSLELLTTKLNIKGISFEVRGEENKGFYFTRKIKVKIESTYLQFLIFLEKIEQYDRILNVTSVKINKKKEAQKGSFKLTDIEFIIETYRYNNAHKEKREIDLSTKEVVKK